MIFNNVCPNIYTNNISKYGQTNYMYLLSTKQPRSSLAPPNDRPSRDSIQSLQLLLVSSKKNLLKEVSGNY